KIMAKLKFLFIIAHCTLIIGNCFSQWLQDVRLTNDPAQSYTSFNNAWCIASSSGYIVHVVWYDNRDGNSEIYYRRSTDGGISWGADTRLTYNSSFSFSPSIAVSGQIVHVVWFDNRDVNWDIYYKRSTDGGVSWGPDTRLTINPTNSDYPSVSVSGQTVHVVWEDDRDSGAIYYKRSTDGGISWGADTRLSFGSNYSSTPSGAVSGQTVHVVWYDERHGYPEI